MEDAHKLKITLYILLLHSHIRFNFDVQFDVNFYSQPSLFNLAFILFDFQIC